MSHFIIYRLFRFNYNFYRCHTIIKYDVIFHLLFESVWFAYKSLWYTSQINLLIENCLLSATTTRSLCVRVISWINEDVRNAKDMKTSYDLHNVNPFYHCDKFFPSSYFRKYYITEEKQLSALAMKFRNMMKGYEQLTRRCDHDQQRLSVTCVI